MSQPFDKHRPLLAGVRVNGGTLTGAAIRHSGRKTVLVTNLHVMDENLFPPDPDAIMHQPWPLVPSDTQNRVGTMLDWVPLKAGIGNTLDVAIIKPDDGVEVSYGIHNPTHDMGVIIPGVKEPEQGMELTVVGSSARVRTGRVIDTNGKTRLFSYNDPATQSLRAYGWSGVVVMEFPLGSISEGDSGAPVLFQEKPGLFRMSAIVFYQETSGSRQRVYAMRASLVESELGITFGIQPKITRRSEENMGIPILTSEGFVGQRWIVDDYFRAGETLYAGDVVGVKQDSLSRGSHPRVFKVTSPGEVRRIIGVVHTPTGKQVGDQVATTGATVAQDDFVPVVVQGVAQALSAVALGVGDPVTPSANSGNPPGKSSLVARVGAVTTGRDTFIGRCLSVTPGPNQVADILVDIAGGYDSAIAMEPPRTAFNVPTNLQVAATSTPGELSVTWNAPSGFDSDRDYYEYQYRENDYEDSEWHPDPEARSYTTGVRISELPGIEHQVQVRAVYNGPNGDLEGKSNWVTATGTPRAATLTPSNDATLSALGITPSSVTLVPAFTGATESYTASAGNAVASLQVRPTVNQGNATVMVNGVAVTSGQQSASISLNVGVSTITVVVTAQDGTTTKTYTVEVTRAAAPVTPSNQAPMADAGAAQTVNTGATVNLSGSGSDPEGDTLSYAWSQLSGTTVSLTNSTSAGASFTAPSSAATLSFRLTVTDIHGASDTDDVTITVQQLLDFSALPGYGQPLDFLDNSYGSIHTLADFNSSALNAISAFTGVDTATQRGMFGINGPLIPNVVGQSVTDIPFFSMWVEEHTLTSSQGVVNWHKRLRIRIYNSSAIIPDWTVEGSGWDFVVEFQPVGGAWQEVLTDNNEDLLDAGFTSATRPIAFIQLQDTFLPQAEYDAFKSFFMADALSQYNVRIRVALD